MGGHRGGRIGGIVGRYGHVICDSEQRLHSDDTTHRMADQDRVDGGIDGGGGGGGGDFEIDYFVLEPFSETAHAILQVATGLEFWVCHRFDCDIGDSMADESTEVLWEAGKGVVTALYVNRSV